MGLFSFVFFKTYFYFALFWILDLINELEISNNKKGSAPQIISRLFNIIYINLGELLSGFLVLYTKLRSKEKKIETIQTGKTEVELIYNDLSLKKNVKILIFLVSILDFLGRNYIIFMLLFFGRVSLQQHHTQWTISIDILARIIFCRYLLKVKLYKHHKFAIYICSIGFLFMAIFALTLIFEDDGKYNSIDSWVCIIVVIITKIMYALGDNLSKILLTQKFILPHFLMFYKSLICLVFYIIFTPIVFLTSNIPFSKIKNLLINDQSIFFNILIILFKIISAFVKSFCIFNIIYIFTPIHVGFLNVVSSLYQIIIQLQYIIFKICYIICLIVIGFGTLIFTEIIVIKKYGLNEYTKVGLLEKEKYDQCPPDSTLLSEYYDDTSEYSDSRNVSQDIIKTRKPFKTVVYNFRRKI